MTISVMQPQNYQDQQGVYRFLYEIWSDEFSRRMDGMDHELRLMRDGLDDTAQHLIAVDRSGRILGCVRTNSLGSSDLPDNLRKSLRVAELVELFGGEAIRYVSHFAVAPEARKKTVASLLILELYRQSLREGVVIGISYCALQYVSFYSQLGYRPYTENFRLDAGVRVPIVHCIRDRGYLLDVGSPLVRLCPRELDDQGAAAGKLSERFPAFRTPGFSKAQTHHLWARLAHAMPHDRTVEKETLFSGLTEQEYRLVSHRLSEIGFIQGEFVFRRGESEQWMAVLLSGSLGVEISVAGVSRIVKVILPGEPFGEISSLGGGLRTADIVALEDSRAVLFPFDFLERVSRADSGLGLKLAKRLLKILAGRHVEVIESMAYCSDVSADSVRVTQPSRYRRPDADEIRDRIESYRFDSLGDREGELKRLITQATIGEDMEFAVLADIGLQDGAKVLDLGSGPGVTSMLMAKRLPRASVIGVEPEDLLREKAEALVASQGFAGRCRFQKGTGEKIPLEDGATDFSYARFLFQHLPNPLATLREMRRVTRRGGIVVVLDVDDHTNILYPAPPGLEELEQRIVEAQAAGGGDRHIGRKLHGYMYETGLQEIGVEPIPITASMLGREAFFSIVYSFKRQVLERTGRLDEHDQALFSDLKEHILNPATFASTTVYAAHGIVP